MILRKIIPLVATKSVMVLPGDDVVTILAAYAEASLTIQEPNYTVKNMGQTASM